MRAKKAVGEKLGKSKENAIVKQKSAAEQQKELAPKLQLIIQRTKELQSNIEQSISKKYKNREVNLMGGVNAM